MPLPNITAKAQLHVMQWLCSVILNVTALRYPLDPRVVVVKIPCALAAASVSQSMSTYSLRCGRWEVKYFMTGLSSRPLMTLCCYFWVVPVDHSYLAVCWLHLINTHIHTLTARFRCLACHVLCHVTHLYTLSFCLKKPPQTTACF